MKKIYIVPALLLSALSSRAQMQEFFTSGAYTVPAGVTEITVEVVGPGGSGGGNGTGGGGGGGYSKGTFTVSPGSVHTVTVGTGGSMGATSFGMLLTATGGGNGVTVSNPAVGGGGAGGTGSGGSVNFTGGTGGGGYYTYFGGGGGGAAGPMGNGGNGGNSIAYTPGSCLTPGGSAGVGGGAPGGNGGKGAGFVDNFCNVADSSDRGEDYGGGGGGGNGNSEPGSQGANGYCKVTWDISTGVNETVNEKLSVSPNPFTNKINLQNAKGNENFVLFGSNGQQVWAGQNISQQDFSNLGTGNYVLQVKTPGGTQSLPLIKK